MSIESSSSSPNSRAVAGASHIHGKKSGKPEAGGSVGGFSALINLLSAADPQDDGVADTAVTSTDSPQIDDKNVPLSPINNGLSAIDVVADQLPPLTAAENAVAMTKLASSEQPEQPEQPEPIASAAMAASDLAGFPVLTGSAESGNVGLALPGAVPALVSGSPVVLAGRVPQPSVSASMSGSGRLEVLDKNNSATGAKPGLGQLATEPAVQSQVVSFLGQRPAAVQTQAVPVELSSSPVVLAGRVPQPSVSASMSSSGRLDVMDMNSTSSTGGKLNMGQLATEQSVQSQMDSILGQRPVAGHPQGLSSVQIDLREVKTQSVLLQQANAPDMTTALSTPGSVDVLPFQKDRLGARPGSSSGAAGSGFEGVFGSAATGYALADGANKIESPSAVVPETALADTVSYWVTHGVQSAELTLDGPDNKPVEVSIVLNGDQAQIEFRTDQAGMRQILEGATTHLKELLSDQGLQLAGVSVGAFGAGGTPGDGRQQKPAARQTAWVSAPQTVPSLGRSANPSVGRTLDLFV